MLLLVADDELRLRKVITLYMRKSGFDVIEAGNCEMALELIDERRPDAIILDIVMPGIDGIEAARRIKSRSDIANIPVILLSANASEHEIEEAKKIGVDKYLTKPFSPKELLSTITELIEKSRNK